MDTTHYLACDLGAESGRLMLGSLSNGLITLREIHRFSNSPVTDQGSLEWDVSGLTDGLHTGLSRVADFGVTVSGISADSWGVDYLLLDERGEVMKPVFHYRDPRSQRGVDRVFSKVSWEFVFAETGIQFMSLNTLFQLSAESEERLNQARVLLGIGDGFNCFLCGRAVSEVSMASTTQLYNPVSRSWSTSLLDAVGLPCRLLAEIVSSGTCLGPVVESYARFECLRHAEVIASCTHDTGAAVAAVPAQGEGWAFLSSGTWSLMGVEWPVPVLSEACRELNFTNEIGFGNTVRLLKNIVGLWIVQECRRSWQLEGDEWSYADLTAAAAAAPAFRSSINPSDPRFLLPGDMTGKIAAFCRETKQPVPGAPGEFIRCVLESLAMLYARTFRQLEVLTGRSLKTLHVVGGGSKNELLNQFTANALQIPVIAGPEEATAVGNVLIQAIAQAKLRDLEHAREVVRRSTTLKRFEPAHSAVWAASMEVFETLPGHGGVPPRKSVTSIKED